MARPKLKKESGVSGEVAAFLDSIGADKRNFCPEGKYSWYAHGAGEIVFSPGDTVHSTMENITQEIVSKVTRLAEQQGQENFKQRLRELIGVEDGY